MPFWEATEKSRIKFFWNYYWKFRKEGENFMGGNWTVEKSMKGDFEKNISAFKLSDEWKNRRFNYKLFVAMFFRKIF